MHLYRIFAYDVKDGSLEEPKNLTLIATMPIDNDFKHYVGEYREEL